MIKHLKELNKYREVLYNITVREIKVRYKQSVLGALWAILQPFSLMVVFTVIFSRFAKIPTDGIPYPVFSYSALLPWTFFATSLSFAIPSLVNNMNLVTKVYFPREVMPIASVLTSFIDFCIASVIFAGMLWYYHISITVNILYVIPIIIVQILFTLGVSFWASAVNVKYRDIRYALPLLIQIWMFISPVVYPVSMVPEKFRWIYMMNPLAGIVDSYRKAIVQGQAPDLLYLGLAALISIELFIVSYRYFKSSEKEFADVI